MLLPRSNEYDCVLCSYIADIDWDGENEVILGSYGQVWWQAVFINKLIPYIQGLNDTRINNLYLWFLIGTTSL